MYHKIINAKTNVLNKNLFENREWGVSYLIKTPYLIVNKVNNNSIELVIRKEDIIFYENVKFLKKYNKIKKSYSTVNTFSIIDKSFKPHVTSIIADKLNHIVEFVIFEYGIDLYDKNLKNKYFTLPINNNAIRIGDECMIALSLNGTIFQMRNKSLEYKIDKND